MKRLDTTLLSIATLVLAMGCGGQSDSAGAASPEISDADLVFEQQGTTFVLIRGNLYQAGRGGRLDLIERLYEPDFHQKNYVTRGGILYQKDPNSEKVYPVTREFTDGFEGASSVEALLSEPRWHRYNTDPRKAGTRYNYHDFGNRIEVSRDRAHRGNASLRFHARPRSDSVSKAAISKNVMYMAKGDDLHFSGWFFVEDTPSLSDAGAFAVLDFESGFLRYAGLRMIFMRNDALAFELKMPKIPFEQEKGKEVPFPTGRWVHVEARVLLSDDNGRVRIWQDGRKVLDKRGRTLPLADTVYDNLELGVTAIAKGSRYEKVLYVDDIELKVQPGSE